MIWLWSLTGITIAVLLFNKFTTKLNEDSTLNTAGFELIGGRRISQIIISVVGILITLWIFSFLCNT